jgi:hypothetical protein
VRNFVMTPTKGLLLLTRKMRILLKRFSASIPDFVKNSRWREADVCESPDLRIISEMFNSPLSIITVSTLVLP